MVGVAVGAAVGFAVGFGLAVGAVVGFGVGLAVGLGVAVGFGLAVGVAVAAVVGFGVALAGGVTTGDALASAAGGCGRTRATRRWPSRSSRFSCEPRESIRATPWSAARNAASWSITGWSHASRAVASCETRTTLPFVPYLPENELQPA